MTLATALLVKPLFLIALFGTARLAAIAIRRCWPPHVRPALRRKLYS